MLTEIIKQDMPDVEHVMILTILTPEGKPKPVDNELIEILKASELNGETDVEEVIRKRLLEIINNDENYIGWFKNREHYFKRNVNGNNLLMVQKNDVIHFYNIPNHNSNGGEVGMDQTNREKEPWEYFIEETIRRREERESTHKQDAKKNQPYQSVFQVDNLQFTGTGGVINGHKIEGLSDIADKLRKSLNSGNSNHNEKSEYTLVDWLESLREGNQNNDNSNEIYMTEELPRLEERIEKPEKSKQKQEIPYVDVEIVEEPKVNVEEFQREHPLAEDKPIELPKYKKERWYHRFGSAMKRFFRWLNKRFEPVPEDRFGYLHDKELFNDPRRYQETIRKLEDDIKEKRQELLNLGGIDPKEIYSRVEELMDLDMRTRKRRQDGLLWSLGLRGMIREYESHLKSEEADHRINVLNFMKELLEREQEFWRTYESKLRNLNELRDEYRNLEDSIANLKESCEAYARTAVEEDKGTRLRWWEWFGLLPTKPKYI